MSDIYFKNYKKRDDTGEIPITQSEKDFQDRLNQQKYEEIIKNQERLGTFESYQNGERPVNNQHDDSGSKKSKKDKKKKKKKGCGCGCGTLLIIFLLIIAIIPVGSIGYVYSLCSKTNYVESTISTKAEDPNY